MSEIVGDVCECVNECVCKEILTKNVDVSKKNGYKIFYHLYNTVGL